MGAKRDILHQGKNVNWGCLRTRYRGEYMDLRVRKWWKSGENFIMMSSINCALLGRSHQGGWDGQDM